MVSRLLEYPRYLLLLNCTYEVMNFKTCPHGNSICCTKQPDDHNEFISLFWQSMINLLYKTQFSLSPLICYISISAFNGKQWMPALDSSLLLFGLNRIKSIRQTRLQCDWITIDYMIGAVHTCSHGTKRRHFILGECSVLETWRCG